MALFHATRTFALATAALLLCGAADLPAPLHVDASAPAQAPGPSPVAGGTALSPDGTRLGFNARYLTQNGQPWFPVMGEFHFARFPANEWDTALARMKASGIDIVSTYLMWNYHEGEAGQFDWKDERDLRRFIEAAQRHDLKVWLRLGPWVHAEVRHGGLPDWLVRKGPLRNNDPAYMASVERYWREAARQVEGLMWKDGGPVVGIQLENEYNQSGPGAGAEHIAALKALALRLGFDVPFYTVTGWNNATWPTDAVLPVYGGYPDEPWSRSARELDAPEVYAFRFTNRVGGDLGAQTAGDARLATRALADTPFIGVEYGGGVPTMYRRRPVLTPEDIGAMLPVQLGSGVNAYGYYMYHGGRNPMAGNGLQESTATGSYNDLPLIDYDFQAPYGAYGDANPSLNAVRPFHLFLHEWGSMLAPMTVHRPDTVPQGAKDLGPLRFSVRSNGDQAFLFANNHVRQHPMVQRKEVRFAVDLPGGTVTFPERPLTIPDGAYFIWPVNLPTAAARIDWASVQPLTRIDTAEGPLTVFAATTGVRASMAIRATSVKATKGTVRRKGQGWIVDDITPGTDAVIAVQGEGGKTERFLVLGQDQARQLWRLEIGGKPHLLLTDTDVTPGDTALTLTSHGNPHLTWATLPALPAASVPASTARQSRDGLFTRWTAQLPNRQVPVEVTPTRPAGKVPPLRTGGPSNTVQEPYPESWNAAARWSLKLDTAALAALPDATLAIDWRGDIARLFTDDTLLDDHYYDGRTWRIKLRSLGKASSGALTLSVLPIPGDTPVYLDKAARAQIPQTGQSASIEAVRVLPDYRVEISTRP